jgi:hypothetical protein
MEGREGRDGEEGERRKGEGRGGGERDYLIRRLNSFKFRGRKELRALSNEFAHRNINGI